jgi:hypothetical protein
VAVVAGKAAAVAAPGAKGHPAAVVAVASNQILRSFCGVVRTA